MGDASNPRVGGGVLDEQLAYYRARAPEYDRWFLREGRYDRGDESNAAWFAELEEVRGILDGLDLGAKRVLELASGTGLWTAELLDRGALVTAVDGAQEMVDQLRQRVGDRVEVVLADLFAWRPPRAFDAVVSCFFISHVPDERLGEFAALVADGCRPGGAVLLLDGLREDTSTAADHVLPDDGDQTMRRRLDDGREYRIVKRFRGDDELVDAFAAARVHLEVTRTQRYFQVAVGQRRA